MKKSSFFSRITGAADQETDADYFGSIPHADLMRPTRRIVAYVDAARAEPILGDFVVAHPSAWHGTMTANGFRPSAWPTSRAAPGSPSRAAMSP